MNGEINVLYNRNHSQLWRFVSLLISWIWMIISALRPDGHHRPVWLCSDSGWRTAKTRVSKHVMTFFLSFKKNSAVRPLSKSPTAPGVFMMCVCVCVCVCSLLTAVYVYLYIYIYIYIHIWVWDMITSESVFGWVRIFFLETLSNNMWWCRCCLTIIF